VDTKCLGICSYYDRLIFVNIRGKQTLIELRKTLVHELVHYRFHYMSHKAMEQRIKLVLKGKRYDRKHIPVPQVPFL
jgi:hypothetical protein